MNNTQAFSNVGHERQDDLLHEIDRESHLYYHVLDPHHYVRHVRPAAGINDTLVVTVDVTLTSVHGLVSWSSIKMIEINK